MSSVRILEPPGYSFRDQYPGAGDGILRHMGREGVALRTVRARRAGTDGVDPDLRPAHLGHIAGQHVQAVLGGPVGELWGMEVNAAQVRTVMMLPFPAAFISGTN
jgi:hypothetical protein